MRSKDTHQTHWFQHFIMTRSIALNLLSKGNNGIELLKILDVIATEEAEQSSWTPIDVIQFWWYNLLSAAAVIRGSTLSLFGSYSWAAVYYAVAVIAAERVMGGRL